MEALGAGANTLAFLLLALKCAKEAHNLLSDIKDAPSKVNALASDIRFLQGILERFSNLTDAQLRLIPTHEAASFEALVRNCYEEISAIADWLRPIYAFPSEGRAWKVVKRIYASLREKDLEGKRTTIHWQALKLDLYLALLQFHNLGQSEDSSNLLSKILGEIKRVHSRLDERGHAEQSSRERDDSAASATDTAFAESVARLGELAHENECTLDGRHAQEIMDSIQTILASIKGTAFQKVNSGCKAHPQHSTTLSGSGTSPGSDDLLHDLRVSESLAYASPTIELNRLGKSFLSTC